MHVFEVMHHLIKEYSITKWFLTDEGRAVEKKKPLVLCSFPIHKAAAWKSGATYNGERDLFPGDNWYQFTLAQDTDIIKENGSVMFNKNKGCKSSPSQIYDTAETNLCQIIGDS